MGALVSATAGAHDLRSAARALGGEVSSGQIRCPGPGHSRSDRSLSVKLGDDGPIVFSHSGDDWRQCRDFVRERLGFPKWQARADDRPVDGINGHAAKPKTAEQAEADAWTCITPVPDEAFPLDVRLGGKEPRQTWLFRDVEGRVLGVECRWPKSDGGKDVRFASWCRHENGKESWRLKHLPAPRPIFGLDRLAQAPLAPVLIVEGPKKVAPALKLFPDHVAIAWPGGTGNVEHVDWSPLKGRAIVIWPDNDDVGRKAAATTAELVLKVDADSVLVVPVPTDFPPKWDLADIPPAGADLAAILEAARPAKAAAPTYPAGFRMHDRGLVWSDPSDDEKPEVVVSGKFEVLAESRDDRGQSWGVLLKWSDPDGRSREWAMPRSILATDGADVRKVLLDGGLYVGAGTKARNLLVNFLTAVHVEARARAVSATGWYGAAFVLPDGAIGKQNGERVILQTSGAVDHAYNVRGTLGEWQDQVARYAVGNSRLVLAISIAFAAALVGPCGEESGGVHLRGPSSTGKTTALTTAGSVWGGGDTKFVRAWRATSNGLEAVATSHNDALLCLDELAQLGGREAGEVAYMLANGSGKARASRDAMLRKSAKWRLLFLSSGEIGLSDKIAEDARGKRQTAGQKVRVVDVPADTGSGFGLFETLHGFADPGALAKHLSAAASQHYGTAARAFIEEIATDLDKLRDAVKVGVRDFIAEHCPAGADGQVQRVAGRFGLIAVAGEIATAVGVLPWPPGEALRAAKTCFHAWIECRGGVEPAEVRDGIASVRAFISAHGASRFLAAWDDKADETRITNLAGFRKRVSDGEGSAFDFYVTTEAWVEVCSGFDPKSLASSLAERGMLLTPEEGQHRAKKLRIPGHGQRRVYHLSAEMLGGVDA
jgi:uncharacterized protein (DUF927 family)